MADLFESIVWNEGQINPSGLASEIYFCPKYNIEQGGYPRPVAVPATASENVSLDGNFVMKAGKYFLKLYSTQGKGKVNWETLGEKDCKMFKNKGTFKYPDISDAGKSLAKQLINANCIIVVKLPHETEKRYVMLGDADYDTTSTITGDSGDEPGSAKGITIEIEAPCTTPLPNYVGTIELEDGTLDCSTGIFTPTGS